MARNIINSRYSLNTAIMSSPIHLQFLTYRVHHNSVGKLKNLKWVKRKKQHDGNFVHNNQYHFTYLCFFRVINMASPVIWHTLHHSSTHHYTLLTIPCSTIVITHLIPPQRFCRFRDTGGILFVVFYQTVGCRDLDAHGLHPHVLSTDVEEFYVRARTHTHTHICFFIVRYFEKIHKGRLQPHVK